MEAEIDFKNFGLVLDENLVLQIEEALAEIYSLGDLNLRSAWLYYGSIPAAAQALQIDPALYEQGLLNRSLRGILSAVERLSDRDYDLIRAGACMILEMPDAQRRALFEPPIDYSQLSVLAAKWFEENSDVFARSSLPITAAFNVLEAYTWPKRLRNRPIRLSRDSFQGGAIAAPLRAILNSRPLVETLAADSKLCKLALEIVRQYDIRCWHRAQLTQYIKQGRAVLKRRHDEFFNALVIRDGRICFICKRRKHILHIDHWIPLAQLGSNELSNFRLLCRPCNSKKSSRLIKD